MSGANASPTGRSHQEVSFAYPGFCSVLISARQRHTNSQHWILLQEARANAADQIGGKVEAVLVQGSARQVREQPMRQRTQIPISGYLERLGYFVLRQKQIQIRL